MTDGPLAFYSFDKNTVAGDELEDLWSENHGKIVGQPKSVTGKINEGLEFNGTSSGRMPLPPWGWIAMVRPLR